MLLHLLSSPKPSSFLFQPPENPTRFHPRSLKLPPLLSSSNPNPNTDPINDARKEASRADDDDVIATDEDKDRLLRLKPRKPRGRGRPSEASAVEDFVRKSLGRTFSSIRENKELVLKRRKKAPKEVDEEEHAFELEEEDPDWPLDADVGWGLRASEYFAEHPIKNVVVDDEEVDWEGDMVRGWVQEINILEWESIVFHPSPLILFVFERYKRAAESWRFLKEIEKAFKVYWSAKDRLPPRAVKFDVNIEKDLAYALKIQECPQLLFLRGDVILYREKEIRTADELVKMIAHFYYNAKRPACMNKA